ncbi:SDR family oxidoreductase [Pedobacter xixiisoli]|uniref:dTDP-4-dehydrorhamnose reductase n=1 Tax=Pedobacter xixiisoli TaxID=1476464 RepID=A0A286A9J1_9SPHI|nr:SDR family oxidoreductase [Pedobacter xixiisoli]SOD18584.1 dTDP-4-dehydrorhamnose reductase [Pedobacter xixiisoli]
MKTVLVTGSNGLLGQKITEQVLADKSVNLIATNRGANKYPIVEGYIYETMDILDSKEVKTVLEKYRPDALIHTAAMTNVDTCHEQNEACRQLNVEATQCLASLCENMGIHFIYVSTDFVFDGLNGPYRENDEPKPVSFYGESKLAGERITQQMKGDWAIIRTILVYGILKDMSRSNIVLWAKGALEKGNPINVVIDQWRMPTLAEDLAKACLLAVEHKAKGIYHISGKDMMTIVDLVRRVADFWNLDKNLIREISSESLGQEAKRPKKTGFILDKAMTDLNYQPHSFEEGLEIMSSQLSEISSQ